jgi:hypothetical protein
MEYIDDLGIDRAMEMMEDINERPITDHILAAVHLKPREKKSKAPRNEQDAYAQLSSLAASLGPEVPAGNKLPPHLKDLAMWASDQTKLMDRPN